MVDGVTPERADAAATHDLADALSRRRRELLLSVRQPDDGKFFTHDGLMLLVDAQDGEEDDGTTDRRTAFPGCAGRRSEPARRIADNLSTALLGVQHGQAKLEDIGGPMRGLAETLDDVVAGKPAYLSWRALVTGSKPGLRETRRFIEVRPRLDYQSLMPGQQATTLIRATAEKLKLNPQNGVTVRLTGSVPMADDEFGSLAQRARLMATLMMVAVLSMLWFALSSTRLIFSRSFSPSLSTLTLTTATGLLFVGAFNLISVAFIALFVGRGVDFGIQFCVRYREERFRSKDLDLGLLHTGSGIGSALALALAAAATAAGFYSFLPTSYRGVAELGFVAGTGMIITFVLSITFLPGVVKLLKPLR